LRVVEQHLGSDGVDYCVVNSATDCARGWKSPEPGWEPVVCDEDQIFALGAVPIKTDLVGKQMGRPHHDPARLGRVVMTIARARLRQSEAVMAARAAQSDPATNSRGAVPPCPNQYAIA
jgi:hypothetical protein